MISTIAKVFFFPVIEKINSAVSKYHLPLVKLLSSFVLIHSVQDYNRFPMEWRIEYKRKTYN